MRLNAAWMLSILRNTWRVYGHSNTFLQALRIGGGHLILWVEAPGRGEGSMEIETYAITRVPFCIVYPLFSASLVG